MCDVFEGRVWRDFQTFNGSSFLASPRNYGFMLNVDWMQPFDHTPYSVGVLYLVLMNLSRSERFKRQNTFLVGIIPGPNEHRININSFLAPLVDEFIKLWEEGVNLRHSGSLLLPERFRAALLCVACDMPPARKFVGLQRIIPNMVAINVPNNSEQVVLVSRRIIPDLIRVLREIL
jgi:hypothetical protein